MLFLIALLLGILALFASAAPTQPLHINHARSAPQYYCSHAYQVMHVFHTTYIISGRGSIVHEPLLKETVESTPLCSITRWDYVEDDDGTGRNDFDLMFDFNLACAAKLEKKLSQLFGEKIKCPKVDWKKHVELEVGLHDDLDAYTDWEESHE